MLGLSVTGFSVADTLAELGAEVLVVTEKADEDYERLLPVIGARLWTGPLDSVPAELSEFAPDVIIASPGFAPGHPVISWAQRIRASRCGATSSSRGACATRSLRPDGRPADWILITGTNGKTTTTRLTATMLVEGGLRAAPVGNIGTPVLDAVRDPAGFDALVVELSSHQLWYLGLQSGPDPVSPHASVCLNLADDHLEWHGSFDAYRDAKAHVYDSTRVACVYNKADAATMRMVEDAEVVDGARAIGFDLGVPGPSDFGVVDGILVDRAFLEDRRTSALEITTVEDLERFGLAAPHMVANVLAASALARSLDVPPAAIRHALRDLPARPAPHRGRRDRRGHHVGRRLEGDEPACGGILPRRLPGRGLGRGRSAQGRRHLGPHRRTRLAIEGRDRDRDRTGCRRRGVRATRARRPRVRGGRR